MVAAFETEFVRMEVRRDAFVSSGGPPFRCQWLSSDVVHSEGHIFLSHFLLVQKTFSQKVMANRKGLELHFISQVHNLLLCSFSLVVLCGQIYATINRVQVCSILLEVTKGMPKKLRSTRRPVLPICSAKHVQIQSVVLNTFGGISITSASTTISLTRFFWF